MKRLLLYCVAIVLILTVCFFSVTFYLATSTGARVARQRGAITATGEPLYLTDYTRDPIPDDENACHLVMQAQADLAAFDQAYAALSEFDAHRRLRPDQVEELSKLVEQHAGLYEQLERAAAAPSFDSKADYSQGIAVLLPHVSLFRTGGRALQVKSLVLAYRDQGDAALDQCDLSLRLTAHLQDEPLLVSHLVSIACQGIAAETANHALRVAETSPDARTRLDRSLAALDNRKAGVIALKGERAMGVLTFAQLRTGKLDPAALDIPPSRLTAISRTWIGQAYLNDDEAKYLELMDCYIQAADKTSSEREQTSQAVDAQLKSGGVRYIITRLVVPALDRALAAGENGDTRNRCLRVLLALQEHPPMVKLADLNLPDSVVRDAGGRPLIVRSGDDGWVVYGVGENGVDDGGSFDNTSGRPLDVGFGPLGPPLPVNDDSADDEERS